MPSNKGHSLWGDAWWRLRRDRVAMVCLGLVIIYTLLAVYGEITYQYNTFKDQTPFSQLRTDHRPSS